MIEIGTYKGHATHCQLGYTNAGNEQVAVRFKLESGHMLTWKGYFSEKTTDTTLRALRSCGWQGTDIGEVDGDDGKILCNDVELVVEHEPDREDPSKMWPRIRWVNSVGNPHLELKKRMDQGQRAAFAQRLMGTVLAQQQSSKQDAPPPEPERQQSNRSDEDLPPEAYGADDDIGF